MKHLIEDSKVLKIDAAPGASWGHAIKEAVAIACSQNILVEVIHNAKSYLVDPAEIIRFLDVRSK